MTPTELKEIIDDLALEPALSLRISKGRALHLVMCRLLERVAVPETGQRYGDGPRP